MWMIVIGSDPHKTNFAFGAVVAATGELRSSEAVKASTADFDRVLRWARKLDVERVWAIADCRHVSGPLERFLLARGERIVRVPPKLMAGARQGARQRGQSDRIDAIAVARTALAEGSRRCRWRDWRAPSSRFGCWSTITMTSRDAHRQAGPAALAPA